MAEFVINEIASLEPPGRFLEPHADNKRFKEVSRKRAIEKTCQALRDKKSSVSSHKTPQQTLTRTVSLSAAQSSSDIPSGESTSYLPQQQHFAVPISNVPNHETIHATLGEASPDVQGQSPNIPQSFPKVDAGDQSAVQRQFPGLASLPQCLSKHGEGESANPSEDPIDMLDSIEQASSPDDDRTNVGPVWPLM